MNDVFDIKRFGKYLTYDLKNAWDNYGLSLVIFGCFPLIAMIFAEIFSLIGPSHSLFPANASIANTAAISAAILVIITFPVKTYGKVTGKKEGSDWLMLPASTLEKFLSLLVITCVALPLSFIILTMASNLILSFFNCDFKELLPVGVITEAISDAFNAKAVSYANWVENILAFTLGAMVFKTGKTGKTILSIMAIGMIASAVALMIFGQASIDAQDIESLFGHFEIHKAETVINAILNVIYAVVFLLLGGGIYYRIRTLKH